MSKPEEIQLPKLYNWGKLEKMTYRDWYQSDDNWFQFNGTWCLNSFKKNIWRPTPPPAPPRFVLEDTQNGKKYKFKRCTHTPQAGEFFLYRTGTHLVEGDNTKLHSESDVYEPLED